LAKSARPVVFLALVFAAVLGAQAPALADRIKHPTAVFAGLDKITGRIITFEVAIDETVQFGSLQITPRVCYTRPPTETPQTTAFVEVDEVGTGNDYRRIFSGWMFAASPGLHGIEHPVYDAWLTNCKGGTTIIHTDDSDLTSPPAQPGPANPPAGVNGPAPQQNGQGSKPRAAAPATAPATAPAAPATAAPQLGAPVEIGNAPALRTSPDLPAAPQIPAAPKPQNSRDLLPPADIPNGQRRTPSQQFFPTN
jgi:hypothetical protein